MSVIWRRVFANLAPVFEWILVMILAVIPPAIFELASHGESDIGISFIAKVVYIVSLFSIAYLFRRLYDGWGWSDFGFKRKPSFKANIGYGVTGFAIGSIVFLPFFTLLLPVYSVKVFENYRELVAGMNLLTLIALATTLLLWSALIDTAIPEEFTWRGYLQGILTKCVGDAWALLIASVVFMSMHYFANPGWHIGMVLITLPLGLLMGLLYIETENLMPSIVMHFLFNYLYFFPMLFYIRGEHCLAYTTLIIYAIASMVIIYAQREFTKKLLHRFYTLIHGLKSEVNTVITGIIALVLLELFLLSMHVGKSLLTQCPSIGAGVLVASILSLALMTHLAWKLHGKTSV